MEGVIQILPARCIRCGALFDMSYDLGFERESEFEIVDISEKAWPRPRLCWKCRF